MADNNQNNSINSDDDLSILARQIAGFVNQKIQRSNQINMNLDNEYEYLHYGISSKSAAENRNIKRLPSGPTLGSTQNNPNNPMRAGR